MQRQDLSCTYLAHHELEDAFTTILTIIIIIVLLLLLLFTLLLLLLVMSQQHVTSCGVRLWRCGR